MTANGTRGEKTSSLKPNVVATLLSINYEVSCAMTRASRSSAVANLDPKSSQRLVVADATQWGIRPVDPNAAPQFAGRLGDLGATQAVAVLAGLLLSLYPPRAHPGLKSSTSLGTAAQRGQPFLRWRPDSGV